MYEWISIEDGLPKKPEYDWVLVQCRMVPEGYYGVPHVAELRRGEWYIAHLDGPLEETLGVEVTHWMSLPDQPNDEHSRNNNENDILTMYLTKEEEIGETALYEVTFPLGNAAGIKGVNIKKGGLS